jgi:lysophospholipase L1-like esterase
MLATLAAFVALHFAAAHAELLKPELNVTVSATTMAEPATTPAVVPAVVAPARPAIDLAKPHILPPAAGAISALACTAPAEFARFDRPLSRTARRLAIGKPLTIVAIGSSSTAGAGASSSAASYPSRLAIELRRRFPKQDITVLNRGVNGEETEDMMARFQTGVIAAHPQLVLWQIGTNSVLRDHPLKSHGVALREGIDELKATGADVLLIDPQYAPKVLAKSETAGMIEQIAATAKAENIDLFQRFAVMRNWHDVQHLPFNVFVSPDGLHMNDWGYACWAKILAKGIAAAAILPVASATAPVQR